MIVHKLYIEGLIMIKNFVTGLLICVVGGVLFTGSANAANCASPVGAEGDVIFNTASNVPQYCNGTAWVSFGPLNVAGGGGGCSTPSGVRGDLLYNSAQSVLQYCNGTAWRTAQGGVSGGSFVGPAACPTIGSDCGDSTVFAGFHPVTQAHLFTPTTNQGSVKWRTSGAADDIAIDSWGDGRSNTTQVVNSAAYIASSSTFAAIKACEDSTVGGYTDWYLPSIGELEYLFMIKDSLGSGALSSGYYWSSSEILDSGTHYAWSIAFTSTMAVNYGSKTAPTYNVRCLRR